MQKEYGCLLYSTATTDRLNVADRDKKQISGKRGSLLRGHRCCAPSKSGAELALQQ